MACGFCGCVISSGAVCFFLHEAHRRSLQVYPQQSLCRVGTALAVGSFCSRFYVKFMDV